MPIKELRKNLGITQREFAQKFDVPLHTVQMWEQGQRNPKEYTVKMIVRLIECERRISELEMELREPKEYEKRVFERLLTFEKRLMELEQERKEERE